MVSMLRTRRSTSCGNSSVSSLPSYVEHSADFSCPGLDDSSSSSSSSNCSYEEDEVFPLKITESYPLCRVNSFRQRQLALRSMLVRTVLVIAVVLAVGFNLSSMQKEPSEASAASAAAASSPDLDSFDAIRDIHVARRLTSTTEQVRSLKSLTDENKLRKSSEQRIAKEFGEGPHLVEFHLNIWQDDGVMVPHFFTIELAPSHLMPASVYFFLRQVSNRLWDGTSIYLNAEHVLAVHPVTSDGATSKLAQFSHWGLSTLPIAEYSEGYPHLPYTLGFNGNGPSFYINKKYNLHHDACFANVVMGRHVIDKIARLPGHKADPVRLQRPIDIVSARLVDPNQMSPRARREYLSNTRIQ